MLDNLSIRNYTIIDRLELGFQGGFSALTGETGTGKSIVVDALALALGNRADSADIRDGCDECEISAVFNLEDAPDAQRWLSDNALGDEALCILRRLLYPSKPGRAFINGAPVTLRQLRALGILLADIHGQHEHQALLRRDQQRRVIDDFCGHRQQLDELAALYHRHAGLQAALGEAQADGDDGERMEYLDYQVRELEGLGLVEGEVAALDEELRRLANAGSLLEGMQRTLEALDGGEEQALIHGLGRARAELRRLAESDKRLAETGALLDEAAAGLDEAAARLRHALDRTDLDPERLGEVEARIGALHDVARKHRVPPGELPGKLEALQAEREQLAQRSVRVAALRAERNEVLDAYRTLAAEISERRRKTTKKLERVVTGEIRQLGMPGAGFSVDIAYQPDAEPALAGWDHVEFLVTTNPGQLLRPLTRVASGGELSRISLAIRVACDAPGPIPTLVFDEVDTGAGGRIADLIGGKIRALAGNRQILCITHLPQVAARGHHHYKVVKNSGQSLSVGVQSMDDEQRVGEIGRMLGGSKVTARALAHARELLNTGQQ